MLFHHIFTVLLLGMAFVVNAVQIATLILLIHDISDVPLEVSYYLPTLSYIIIHLFVCFVSVAVSKVIQVHKV